MVEMMNIRKRIIATLAVCLCAAAVTAGCHTEEAAEEKEKTELTIWHYWDVEDSVNYLEDVAADYNRSQDSVEVVLRYIPDEDFKKQLALSMAEDNMPDIAMVDSSDFLFFNSMREFVDLTDRISDLESYSQNALAPCSVDGRIRGLPMGLNCTALFYNKKMLEQKGADVPKTWEEFYETASKFSDDSAYGVAISALRSEESLYQFLPLFWSMGGDVRQINSSESIKAFEYIRSLVKSNAMSPESINLTMGDVMHQFVKGNIAMAFAAPADVSRIRCENKNLDFDVTYLPADSQGNSVSVLGGEVMGVTKGKCEDEAVDFLKYISSKETMVSYMDKLGFLAPREDIMNQQFQSDPVRRKFLDIYKTAKPRELSEDWPRISIVISTAMGEVVTSERPVEDILNEAKFKIDEIVREG